MSNLKFFILCFLPALIFFSSCSDTITNYDEHITIADSLGWGSYKDIVNNVTDIPGSIMTYSEMGNIPRGTIMKLRVSREDYQVWEVNVIFDALYKEGNERLILCHSPSIFPVGSGDSGSPLLTQDGKVAGVLCYGYYGNSNDFAARAVEDVLNIDATDPTPAGGSTLFDVVLPAYIASGLNKEAAERYPFIDKLLKNSTIQREYDPNYKTGISKNTANLAIPGSSVAILYVSGDYVLAGAVGTMSFFENEKIYAFGHQYSTFAAAPAYLACTKSFISTIETSFKMAEPTDELIGSLTVNHYNGILINRNVAPIVINLQTDCSLNGTGQFSYKHQMANSLNFEYDLTRSADLSCYLIYNCALLPNSLSNDSVKAECNLYITTDKESVSYSFIVEGQTIDYLIYYYIRELQIEYENRKLKDFNLGVNLLY